MGLMNSKGRWTHPIVASIGNTLLPQNVTKHNLMALVEEMATNAIKTLIYIICLNLYRGITKS